MIELAVLTALSIFLLAIALAGMVVLADKCLDLAERVRILIHQGSKDAIDIWLSAGNSRLDVEKRRAQLEHDRRSSRLALAAQREKLALGRQYGYLRLRSEQARLLGAGEKEKVQ